MDATIPREKCRLSAHELRAVSTVAVVHPATVTRYLGGLRVHAANAERIAKALQTLGLTSVGALGTFDIAPGGAALGAGSAGK